MAEHQVRHDTDVRELREIQKGMGLAIAKVAEAHRRTGELQQVTEQSLDALTCKVDRIISREGGTP
jgi:hypothetical protein